MIVSHFSSAMRVPKCSMLIRSDDICVLNGVALLGIINYSSRQFIVLRLVE